MGTQDNVLYVKIKIISKKVGISFPLDFDVTSYVLEMLLNLINNVCCFGGFAEM